MMAHRTPPKDGVVPPVVHVGLGKTATTTFQTHVFPQLALMAGYQYNPAPVMQALRYRACADLTAQLAATIADHLRSRPTFISSEVLAGFFPDYWEENADLDLQCFGPKATIILTLRDPKDYMRSLYVQMLRHGLAGAPEHFFLDARTQARVKAISPFVERMTFNVDAADYSRLLDLYRARFDDVRIVPFDSMDQFQVLQAVFNLSETQRATLQHIASNAPRENQSFSATGVSLTHWRARLLGRYAEQHASLDRLKSSINTVKPDLPGEGAPTPWQDLSSTDKVRQFPARARRRLPRLYTWGDVVTHVVDRIVPYRPYHLPDDLYLNDDLIAANRRFLANAQVAIDAPTGDQTSRPAVKR